MKKDRNTFFQEASYMNMGFPNQNLNIANNPFQAQSAFQQGFYQGPLNFPNNYNTGMNQNQNNYQNSDYSDLEGRISKLERQINRIDMRLSKLEQNSFYTTDDIDNTTNVYMV